MSFMFLILHPLRLGWVVALTLAALALATAVIQTVARSRKPGRGNPTVITSHHTFRIPLGPVVVALGDSILWHPWFRLSHYVDPAKGENGRPKTVGWGFQTPFFSFSISRSWPYPWTDHHEAAQAKRAVFRRRLSKIDKALHHAVDYDKPQELTMLLDAGADIEARDKYGATLLMRAAINGNYYLFQLLVARGARIDVEDDHQLNPLMEAVLGENPDIVRYLLGHGADPNSRTTGEITALHWAVSGDSVEVVRLLLDYGARIDAKERHTSLGSVLHRAVHDDRTSNFEILEELLKRGADVNELDNIYGSTVLMKAAGCGDVPLIRLLLARGADPSVRCRYGTTALSRAQAARCPEAVDLIRDAPAGANCPI